MKLKMYAVVRKSKKITRNDLYDKCIYKNTAQNVKIHFKKSRVFIPLKESHCIWY